MMKDVKMFSREFHSSSQAYITLTWYITPPFPLDHFLGSEFKYEVGIVKVFKNNKPKFPAS